MKKLTALLLALLMMTSAALAEFDLDELCRTADCEVREEPGTVDTVVRPVNQPYWGEVDAEGDLCMFVDYIHKIDYEATFLRVLLSISTFDPVGVDQVAFTVGGKTYTFSVQGEMYEYEGIYMEDIAFCLTDVSLPFLKAIAQQKKDNPLEITFLSYGEEALTGRVIVPGADAALLYDRYIDLGGKKQELKQYDELWPCEITKN